MRMRFDRLPVGLWIVFAMVFGLAMSAFAQPEMLGRGSVTIYEDTGKGGESLTLNLKDYEQGKVHKLEKLGDAMSSLEYTLPPCFVVVFYEDGDGGGKQLAVWGSGLIKDTNDHAMKDNASSWAWYPTR